MILPSRYPIPTLGRLWLTLMAALISIAGVPAARAEIVTFESLPFGPVGSGFENHYNGDTRIPDENPLRDNFEKIGTSLSFGETEFNQRWNSGGLKFENNFTPEFNAWTGWSWSRVTDNTTPGFGNQYSAFPGGGSPLDGGPADTGGGYAMAFSEGAFFNVPDRSRLRSVDVANSTWAALSMLNGDGEGGFAKQFGGPTGDDPDFFRVTLTGYDQTGTAGKDIGSIQVDLADYTFGDNSRDYVLEGWKTVDLDDIAAARSVGLSFDSSDVGDFGINTPTYLAVDNIRFATAIPEPGSLLALSSVVCLAVATGLVRRVRARRTSPLG